MVRTYIRIWSSTQYLASYYYYYYYSDSTIRYVAMECVRNDDVLFVHARSITPILSAGKRVNSTENNRTLGGAFVCIGMPFVVCMQVNLTNANNSIV